jgi:hypothetical protein
MTTSKVPNPSQHIVTFPAGASDLVILLSQW